MSTRSVAVTVITRNRPDSLEYCLTCVMLQSHPANEVIVIDSSTDTRSRELVLARFPYVRYFHITAPLGSQPRLRNLALRNAESDIIAAIDDDGYPRPEWLSEILRCYESGVGAVGGRILQGSVDEGRNQQRPVVGTISPAGGAMANFNAVWPEPFEVDHLQGTNMSFRRDLLIEAGGWDLALESGYAAYEDTETCLRIKRLGYKVLYAPAAIVQHGLEPRQGGFTRDFGVSVPLAYSVSRNAVYTILRSYRLTPRVVLGAGILAPALNVARSILPRNAATGRRTLSVSILRLRTASAIIAGHLSGLVCLIRARKTNLLPRLLPGGQA